MSKIVIYNNGFKIGDKGLKTLLKEHRFAVLERYVDKHFMTMDCYVDKIELFMNGLIRFDIMDALDDEFHILRDSKSIEEIDDMVEAKIIKFINEV